MAQASPIAISPPLLAPAGSAQSSQTAITPKSSGDPLSAIPATSGVTSPLTSLTSKEWVVPPRPKPGRKPATDAPPTKRKAQNRAAQKAFRERRAARVGELEEELKKIEMEDEEEKNALRARIDKLDKEVEEYRTSLDFWMQRCRGLEADLAIESAAKEEALQRSKEATRATVARSPNDKTQGELPQDGDEVTGCGNCSSISNCRCIQEVINMQSLDPNAHHADVTSNKRPHSPPHNHSNSKRIKAEPLDDLETDFTNSFSMQQSGNTRESRTSPSSPSASVDPCGFCTDGTPCICAQMQAEAEANNINSHSNDQQRHTFDQNHTTSQSLELGSEQQSSSSLFPRISQLSHITPPPSDTDVSIPNPSGWQQYSSSSSDPCINGPGTCLQCRSDPNSTLFCKSLAKSREQKGKIVSIPSHQQQNGCCSANATNGNACCQATGPRHQADASKRSTAPTRRTRSCNQNTNSEEDGKEEEENVSQLPTITLSCADAYTTLSRHPGYTKATGEMARWLPRLHATPAIPADHIGSSSEWQAGSNGSAAGVDVSVPGNGGGGIMVEGRPALEIDAANVMAVLREFDRRFT
ncbi:hypothetical protein EPUS_03856 [Endocarpon pusillum Z07020]|uniref:BZIP domain-containing protein n=1 Tax=Endocarpon pusillum (strain Z07020 / HMAS-L-300199) TaxID=1263415 RepID=U1GPZ5_ENDPU|nr:uncharacterized protein EPUS_03856 [Endocarpon pusillum Z07020]ERF74041.1 hypothetical protein EPUS_03856 [Endocarpon pusillum Z07020]